MEDKDLKNNGGLTQEGASLATRRRGKGASVIIEYLFTEIPVIGSSSDQTMKTLSEEEELSIAKVVDYFLKAQYDETIAEAERCMNSRHPEISDFALLAHALGNVAQNKIEAALKDLQTLQGKEQNSENTGTASVNRIYRYMMSVFFNLGEEIAPIPLETFRNSSEGVRLFALYARSYAFYLQQQYAQALGVAEAALMMAADRHPLISIYLNLAASMAAINLSRFEQADRFFLDALELAIPEGYVQPFIGHHGPLQGLVEKHIRDQQPELYKMISGNVVRFRRGWTEIHNPRSSNKVTCLLTPFEFALAMMAAKGKTNREIADYFRMSINTVKARLSTIYRKVSITKRSELQQHLNQ